MGDIHVHLKLNHDGKSKEIYIYLFIYLLKVTEGHRTRKITKNEY